MYPDAARGDLGDCLNRFETTLENLRGIRERLQSSVARIREHADRFGP